MNGLLIIETPPGLTSHDVVSRVRHILRERRVGHTGTLDPFATGVLLVLLGRATRLAQFFTTDDKEYDVIFRHAYATETGDITGAPLSGPGATTGWTEDQIESAMAGLRGEIGQTPPMYSAKKIAGRKLYELARRGEEVERKPLRVCIHEFAPIKPTGELLKDNLDGTFDFEVRVVCSSGTYVRTLAEDLGKRLQVGAHLAELRRTRVGDFHIQQAHNLEQMTVSVAEEALSSLMLPTDAALARLPLMDLSAEDVKRVQNGRTVSVSNTKWSDRERVRMRDEQGNLIAVAEFDAASQSLHPSVVIAGENQ